MWFILNATSTTLQAHFIISCVKKLNMKYQLVFLLHVTKHDHDHQPVLYFYSTKNSIIINKVHRNNFKVSSFLCTLCFYDGSIHEYMVGSLLTKWVANDHPSFHKDSKMSRCNVLWLKLLFLDDGFIFWQQYGYTF